MPKRKGLKYWNIPVSIILDDALEVTVRKSSYTTKSDFVRDAVRRRIEEIGFKYQLLSHISSKDEKRGFRLRDSEKKGSFHDANEGKQAVGKYLTEVREKKKTDSVSHQYLQVSLKDRVFRWLNVHKHEKKYGKIVRLSNDLGLNYEVARGYLHQLSSHFKTEVKNGKRRWSPNCQHNWCAVGFVGDFLDRKRIPAIEDVAVELGWALSKNRNRELFWVDRYLGRIRWWATGKVFILVKKPCTLGRAKQLAAKAFIWNKLILDYAAGVEFVQGIHWHSSEDVYLTPNGQPLPYMRISPYKDIFGEIILGDSSHPNGVEIKVCPELLHRHNQQLEASKRAIEKSSKIAEETRDVLKQVSEQTKQFKELLRSFSMPLPPKGEKDKGMVV